MAQQLDLTVKDLGIVANALEFVVRLAYDDITLNEKLGEINNTCESSAGEVTQQEIHETLVEKFNTIYDIVVG